MVDGADVPPLRGDVDIRDRQVVDLMGHRGMGIHAKRALDLCQDHAEMRHGDDVCVRMGLCDPVNGGVDPAGRVVPAFAFGGGDVTRGGPIGAAELGVALRYIAGGWQRPVYRRWQTRG